MLGSTYLTAKTCELLLSTKEHELVGYLPNQKPATVPGKMPIPVASGDQFYDIKLSVQYDMKIKSVDRAFNVHTGILPDWGGTDILYHTLKNKAKEQGLTFHAITDQLDYGPIVSKITYPVFKDDSMIDLYQRLAIICPHFVLSSLRLLESIGIERARECYQEKPTIYRRGSVSQEDLEEYGKTRDALVAIYH